MNLLQKTFCLLLLGAAQTGWSQVAAPTDSWTLLSDAKVDGSGVFLDQVVMPPASGRVLPHLRLAAAPRLGQTNSFSRAIVAGMAQACVPGLVMTNWSGPALAHVSRLVRTMEDSELIDLLTATLQKQYVKGRGELELHLTRPWAKPEVPDQALTLQVVEMPTLGITPNFVAGFELWAGKERLGNWQVPVQAAVWRDIPVAHSLLQRGQALKDADVALERSDVLVLRDSLANFPTTDPNFELTESVPAGRPILSRCVRVRPLVLRGQMVEAVFQDGALGISLMVETLEDGTLGKTVRVRNPKTMRELYGKVVNEKTVSIVL